MAKILIADDDSILAEMYQERLSQEGHQVEMVKNGEDCLDAATLFKPDLILMDIIMPRMNGIETANTLKQNPATQNIPVIFFSQLSPQFQNQSNQFFLAPAFISKSENPPQAVASFINQFLSVQQNAVVTKK